LLGQGDAAGAIPLFIEAAAGETEPRFIALLGLSRAYSATQAPAEAERAARQAIATMPEDCSGHAMLALMLADSALADGGLADGGLADGGLGGRARLDEAAEAARMALGRAAGSSVRTPPLLNLSARIAILRGALPEALGLIDRCLETRPFDRRALSYRPALLRALNIPEAGPPLLDFDSLVKVIRPEAPREFDGMGAFNARIARAVAASPALASAQAGRTLVGGARLPSIGSLGPELALALRGLFRDSVAAYDRGLAVAETHPLIAGRPPRFDIQAWASVMEAGAFERPHIHEGGWVSGVFYPEMPPAEAEEPTAAAIVFGGHDLPETSLPPGPTYVYRPESGDLVLFSSYLHHRTLPFAGPGRRISVAFDAQPGR
jgi:tetratricopeptide (TPR) repeat protein